LVGRDVAESVWAEDLVNRSEMPPLHEDYVGAMRRGGTILEYEICGGRLKISIYHLFILNIFILLIYSLKKKYYSIRVH
jgi:hypothetical protein